MAVDYAALAKTGLYSDKKLGAVQKQLSPTSGSTGTASVAPSYQLKDPTGKSINITAEQAASYNKGANTLASGYSIVTPQNVSSNAVNGSVTTSDVLDARNQKESVAKDSQSFADFLTSNGSTQSQSDIISQFLFPQANPAVDEARTTEQNYLKRAGDYVMGLFGQDTVARREKMQKEAGVADIEKQLQESNLRLARLRGEQMKIRPQIEGEAGQTRIGAEARLNPVERMLQAEIGAEALVQAALTGNLEMVKGNIDKILELEFADQDRDLKIFEQRIKLEQARIDSLQGADKAQAEARLAAAEIMLKDREQLLADERDRKSQLLELASDYVQATGDGAGARDIASGNLSFEAALAKYGPAMKKTSSGDKPMTIKSGTAEFTAQQVQAVATALEASKVWAGYDGYANTDLYLKELANWNLEGGQEADFFKQYPPDKYLRKDDPGIPQYIKDRYWKISDEDLRKTW